MPSSFAKLEVVTTRRPVVLGNRVLHLGVVDEEPSPTLCIATRRSLHGQAKAFDQHVVIDRPFEVESSAHGPRGRQQAVGLGSVERGHRTPVCWSWRLTMPWHRVPSGRQGLCRNVVVISPPTGGEGHPDQEARRNNGHPTIIPTETIRARSSS